MKGVTVFIFLIGLLLLLAIIGVLSLWLGGSKTVLLPGLGIIVAMPLLLALLTTVEVIVLIAAALLWRHSL